MSTRAMTRRSLFAATAGAMASSVMRPGSALAVFAPATAPRLWVREVGQLGAHGATIELGEIADLVGVRWQSPAVSNIELRFRDTRGRWSRWVNAAGHGHGPEAAPPSHAHIGDPVWMGGASAVQLRCAERLLGVRLHLIDVSGEQEASRGPLALMAALPSATPLLDAGAGQPPIIARRAWAGGVCHPRVAPEYGTVQLAFVHHTENPNGYSAAEVPAMLRAIYAFHRYVNGWNDIGYNFVIDLYGRIFEARAGGIDEPVVGAHAGGYNLVSSGVAVLGSFMSVPISTPARRALERLLAWKLSLHGLPSRGRVTVKVNPAGAIYSRYPANAHVALPRIAGHRDADSTDCPGNVLYDELRGIRAAVNRLAPRPVRATLALGSETAATPAPSTPPAPGASPEPQASVEPPAPIPVLTGTLSYLDGTPIAGATILVQARSVARKGELVTETTIAQALSNAQGQWALPTALPGAPTGPVFLRALCTGTSAYGAAVSEALRVSLSAPAATTPTAETLAL